MKAAQPCGVRPASREGTSLRGLRRGPLEAGQGDRAGDGSACAGRDERQCGPARRGGGGGSVGGAMRAREAQRLFHAAASRLCDWADAVSACEKVRRRARSLVAPLACLPRCTTLAMTCLFLPCCPRHGRREGRVPRVTRGAAPEQAFATGTVRAWNELYGADTRLEELLPRKDRRWERVGLSVRKPRMADLKLVFRTVSTGSVVTYEEGSAAESLDQPAPGDRAQDRGGA